MSDSLSFTSTVKKVIDQLELVLIGSLFFTHFFTTARYENTFIEYDYHFVILTLCLYAICKLVCIIMGLSPLYTGDRKIMYFMIATIVYIAIISLIQGRHDNRTLGMFFLLAILYFGYLKILSGSASFFRLILFFLVGLLFCQIYALSNIMFFESHASPNTNVIYTATNACYLAATIPFSLNLILSRKCANKYLRLTRLLALATTTLGLYLCIISLSRTIWLASLAGILILSLQRIDLYRKITSISNLKHYKHLLLITGLIVMVATVYFLYTIRTDSVHGRLLIYEVCLDMLSKKPFFGSGIGSFEHLYNLSQAELLTNTSEPHPFHALADNTFYAFNDYLRFAIEFGILGLCLLIYLLINVFIKCRSLLCNSNFRSISNNTAGAIGSLFSIAICAMTSYPLHLPSVAILVIFYLAIISSDEISGPYVIKPPFRYTLIPFLILFSWRITCECIRMKALSQWETASEFAITNNFEKAQPIYENIYPPLAGNGRFLFNYGAELFIAGHQIQSIRILESSKTLFSHSDLYLYLGRNFDELGQFKKAEDSYKIASAISPSKFTPKKFLLELYIKYDEHNLARQQAINIVKTQIKIPGETVTQIISDAKAYLRKSRSK